MMGWLERLQRVAPISTWALFGAGIGLSAMLSGMVLILWLGAWSAGSEKDRIMYLGVIAITLALDLMAVIAALAKARVAAKGPGNFGFDISSEGVGDAPPNAAKVTVEVPKT